MTYSFSLKSTLVGFSALLIALIGVIMANSPVQAASCPTIPAGTPFLIKGHPAVYMTTEENNIKGRAYFLNSEVFHTWFENFNQVVTLEPKCAEIYKKLSVVSPRPGTLMLKTTFDSTVYAVGPNMTLIKIGSAEVAEKLYGANWASQVRDVSENFLLFFSQSPNTLTEAVPHDGMVVKQKGSDTHYFVHDGNLIRIKSKQAGKLKVKAQEIDSSVFSTLSIQTNDLVTDEEITLDPTQVSYITFMTNDESESESETENEVEIEDESESETEIENESETELDVTLPESSTNPNGVMTEKGTLGTGTYIGQDVFIKPAGITGEWLFGTQVEWRMKKECATGQSYQGSTGAEYDKGVEHGINNALFDMDLLFPIYWATPPVGGSTEYNKGYKYGYENTYSGVYVRKVDCPNALPLSDFNHQGWKKETPKDLHVSFYLPPYPLVSDVRSGMTGDTLMGYQTSGVTVGQVQVITLPWTKFSEQIQFAKWKKDYTAGMKLNIDAIEIAELNADGDKQDVAAMKVAYYNGIKADLKSCVVGDPEYSEETLFNKKVHGVAFLIACTKGSSQTAQQHITYFVELNNKNVVLVHFKNQNELWNGTSIDSSKLSDSVFRKQFLTYLTDNSN